MKINTPIVLFILYIVLFAVLGINPYSRQVWVAENIPIVLVVGVLTVLYFKNIRFSATAYVLMSVLLFLHTIGGHYTFERVPFGWVTNFFGFQRNHFDRVAHFSVGLYAFAVMEFVLARKWVTSRWVAFLFAVFAIFATASVYEIIEWWFAAGSNAQAGAAFLGSQGDIWDAQKDMLADGLGGIISSLLFLVVRKK